MRHRYLIGILVLFSIIAISLPVYAGPKKAGKFAKAIHKEEPIKIVSDILKANDQKGYVIFSGNVVATQGDLKIKCEKLIVYYGKVTKNTKDKKSEAKGRWNKSITKIVAEKNVVITQGNRKAIGNKAVYKKTNRTITLTGNPKVWEKESWVQGKKIIVYLDEDRSEVIGGKKERVTATIYPGEEKEKEKEKK